MEGGGSGVGGGRGRGDSGCGSGRGGEYRVSRRDSGGQGRRVSGDAVVDAGAYCLFVGGK